MGCCASTSKGKFSKIIEPQPTKSSRTQGQTPIYIPTSSKESEFVQDSNQSQEVEKRPEEKLTTSPKEKTYLIEMFRLEEDKYLQPVDSLRGKVEEKKLIQFQRLCEDRGDTYRLYSSFQECKYTLSKEGKKGAIHYIAIENPKLLKISTIENKQLKQINERHLSDLLAKSRNWALEAHQAGLNQSEGQVARISRQFESKAREVVKSLESSYKVLLFNPQHQEVNYIKDGMLIRHIKGVNNNSRVMRDELDILRYYQTEIEIAHILRGAFPKCIAPLLAISFCPHLGCRVLVQSLTPLHHSFLAHGFLHYSSLMINSQEVEFQLQEIKQNFNFSETQYPQTAHFPHISPLNSCVSLFKLGQHFYLHNVGFFFPSLSAGTFSFAHPKTIKKFVENNTPTSVLPLSNRLFLQCSECAQYIVDDSYYKAKTHRMTPQKLKSYVCCNGCYKDFKEYGGDLSCNPQILIKKEVPPEMKAPAYIDEKSMERENSISNFKKHLSPNIGNELLEDRFYQQEKIRDFEKYLISHLFKEYLATLGDRVSIADLMRAREEGLSSMIGRKEWNVVRERVSKETKKELWNWGVALCSQMSENSEDFAERVELGNPELRNEVNGELLWRFGVSLSQQEVEECYEKEGRGEEKEEQEENKT